MINYIISTTKYHQPSNQLTSGPAGLFNVQPKPLKRAQRLLSNQVRCGKAWDVNGLSPGCFDWGYHMKDEHFFGVTRCFTR